jgi:type IV pilus assembly protein PilM
MMRDGMGMGMMGPGGRMSDEEAKKKLKTLTRTDFLLQFVWKKPTPEELPKTEEERATKIKDLVAKLQEAEKNNPAVTIPKSEEIEAASLKKSEEVDSKIQKALGQVAPGATGAAPGTPGFGPPPGAAAPAATPNKAAPAGPGR